MVTVGRIVESWRRWARGLRRETLALYYAYRDPRTPWYARAWAAVVVAYALSPIDLIPDFIPVLGYLDDLILVPLGIAIAIRLVPAEVLVASRERADAALESAAPGRRWVGVAIVAAIWMAALAVAGYFVVRAIRAR